MRSSAFAVVALAAFACGGGPEPRQASGPVPVTHAVWFENPRAVREVRVPEEVSALLAAPDRLPEDRALDERRQSAELLAFLDLKRGMRVAEFGAGGGYVTELLARSVGPEGLVFAVNPPDLVGRLGLGGAWRARLERPADRNVRPVDAAFGAPLPPEARELDLVYVAYPYTDLTSGPSVDRIALEALRRGGRYVVFDRVPNLKREHVAEARNARREIEGAGFAFLVEGRFLRASAMPGDWDGFPASRPTWLEREDRFLMAFTKP